MDINEETVMQHKTKLDELDTLEKMHAEITEQLLEALRDKYAILEKKRALQRGMFSVIRKWKINMEMAALRRKIRRIIAESNK